VVPIARLRVGERVRVELNGRPVEVVRAASGAVTARSLLCTHQGCEVVWEPAESAYVCPCHAGRFDPDGRVAAGPPTSPLGTLDVRVRGTDAVVGG
jgi:cytochrome b6-f complex iron-sulfur subunit